MVYFHPHAAAFLLPGAHKYLADGVSGAQVWAGSLLWQGTLQAGPPRAAAAQESVTDQGAWHLPVLLLKLNIKN